MTLAYLILSTLAALLRKRSQLLCVRQTVCLCDILVFFCWIEQLSLEVAIFSQHWIIPFWWTTICFSLSFLWSCWQRKKIQQWVKTQNSSYPERRVEFRSVSCDKVCVVVFLWVCTQQTSDICQTREYGVFLLVYLLSLSPWPCWAWWLPWSFAPKSWAKSGHRCSWGGPVDSKNTVRQWEVIYNGSVSEQKIRFTEYLSEVTGGCCLN